MKEVPGGLSKTMKLVKTDSWTNGCAGKCYKMFEIPSAPRL